LFSLLDRRLVFVSVWTEEISPEIETQDINESAAFLQQELDSSLCSLSSCLCDCLCIFFLFRFAIYFYLEPSVLTIKQFKTI
jgi:hypothetical protein